MREEKLYNYVENKMIGDEGMVLPEGPLEESHTCLPSTCDSFPVRGGK